MQKWEYLRVEISVVGSSNPRFQVSFNGKSDDSEGVEYREWAIMNKLGLEGWELVSYPANRTMIFKRPISD